MFAGFKTEITCKKCGKIIEVHNTFSKVASIIFAFLIFILISQDSLPIPFIYRLLIIVVLAVLYGIFINFFAPIRKKY